MVALLQPPPPPARRKIPFALACSIVAHVAVLAALLWAARTRPDQIARPQATEAKKPERIVWIARSGPSGGGGGSKAPLPAPPQPVTPPQARAAPESEATPLPAATLVTEPEPLNAQSVPLELAGTASTGVALGPAPVPGNGRGGGSGDGDGRGAGPGKDDGFGGDAFRPGNGVTWPEPLTRASGSYTPEAVRARAQGIISLECVVEPSGQCGDVRIVRAFNPAFGLDAQALAAARRWRFRPGMRGNEPVPVLVRLEIEFRIR